MLEISASIRLGLHQAAAAHLVAPSTVGSLRTVALGSGSCIQFAGTDEAPQPEWGSADTSLAVVAVTVSPERRRHTLLGHTLAYALDRRIARVLSTVEGSHN